MKLTTLDILTVNQSSQKLSQLRCGLLVENYAGTSKLVLMLYGLIRHQKFCCIMPLCKCGMQVWNENYILINERLGKYEMDVSIRDRDTNIILASDAQGYEVHKDTETQDAKKRENFKRQGLVLLQPAGVFLVNNFCGFVEILKETLREVYKESDVHYLKK
ncbi:hypothetical protein P4679_25650 [Priestia megaterium]|uniref:hypothetical protein n=1 Tax=Priestia megaterium TaxID=1404 RepID=UPI002E24E968|nr:hypothetical protein [Priestia megaterium]